MTTTGLPRDAELRPYRGIQPYTERERDLFFGREREQVVITANLRTSRLTILYGTGGVGKSSLLQAGVAPTLREQEASAVIVFREWQSDDYQADLHRQIIDAVNAVLSAEAGADLLSGDAGHLDDLLEMASAALGRTVFVILDQFEDYFLYHESDLRRPGFESELASAINSDEIDANFLFVVPEESLSKLDRLAPRIPYVLGNLFRLNHLERDGAERAIRRPLEEYNRRLSPGIEPVGIEDGLVEALLDQVRSSRVAMQLAGKGQVVRPPTAATERDWYEAPFLQLVLTRLWEEERVGDSSKLRLATLEQLGGAERIVRTYLDQVMSQLDDDDQEIASAVFIYLVTPSGTKIAQDAEALAEWTGLDAGDITRVLNALSLPGRRLLRRVEAPGRDERWEIFHDVLAAATLEWRTRLVREQQQVAFSRELARSALSQLPEHPELSLLLASEAARAASTSQAEDALREALVESHFRMLLTGHTRAVRSVAYSADGATLVTASEDGTVRTWDPANGRQLALLEVTPSVAGACFSPTGELLLIADAAGTVTLLDPATLRPVRTLHTPSALARAAFSPDGRIVVTAQTDGSARLWDVTSGQELLALVGHDAPVEDAQFDRKGERVVTASRDETARVWDAASGRPLVKLLGHTSDVWCAAFSPDGSQVVTTSFDRVVWLWDARTGSRVARLGGHTESVRTATFSRDGRRVVTTSYDGTTRVWDLLTLRVAMALYGHAGRVIDAAFSPDGNYVATASADRTVRTWYVGSEHSLVELVGHGVGINGVNFSPDGRRLVTASGDETAGIWDWAADPPQMVQRLRGHTADVWSAAYDPTGTRVVTASLDGTARIWDATDGRPLVELRGHGDWVSYADFSPNGTRVVTASLDGTARIWDATDGGLLLELTGHDDQVYSAAFSPDGGLVVTASLDDTARVWDARRGSTVAVLHGHTDWVGHASFSPDGRLIVTSSWDRSARVWATGTYEQVGQPLGGHAGRVRSAVFSRDGTYLVTASGDETSFVWETRTWTIVKQLKGHLAPLNYATFTPDGAYVATASHDATARVYELRSRGSLDNLVALARTRVSRQLTAAERGTYLHESPLA
jgi:WD40 repeat protein